MSTEQNKKLVSDFYDEFWGQGNVDAADKYFAPNYTDHQPMPGFEDKPLDGLKFIHSQMAGLSDVSGGCVGPIAEGDKVCCYWEFKAKHTGKYWGCEATNKEITGAGIDIFRIEGGKIVEHWHQENAFDQMCQLGIINPEEMCPSS